MIIVLKQDAPEVQVREFCHELQDMGLQINDSKGSESINKNLNNNFQNTCFHKHKIYISCK